MIRAAQEHQAEQELAIRELGKEHDLLEEELRSEQRAAKLGWKLLWGQKHLIDKLEAENAQAAAEKAEMQGEIGLLKAKLEMQTRIMKLVLMD